MGQLNANANCWATRFTNCIFHPYRFQVGGNIYDKSYPFLAGPWNLVYRQNPISYCTGNATTSHTSTVGTNSYPYIQWRASFSASSSNSSFFATASSNSAGMTAHKVETLTTDTAAYADIDSSVNSGWTSSTNFQISNLFGDLKVANSYANAKIRIIVWTADQGNNDTFVNFDKIIWSAYAQIFNNTLSYSSNFSSTDFTSDATYNGGSGLEVDLNNLTKNITVPGNYDTSKIGITIIVDVNDGIPYTIADGRLTSGINNPGGQVSYPLIYNDNLFCNNVTAGPINIKLYDLNGRLITNLFNGYAEPNLTLPIDNKHLRQGMYIVGILANSRSYTNKIIVP